MKNFDIPIPDELIMTMGKYENKNCDSTWWKNQKLNEFKKSMCLVFCGGTQNVSNCKSDCMIKAINIKNWDMLTLRDILKRGDRQPNK